MRIVMTETVADGDTRHHNGSEYDLPDAQAKGFIERGVAVAVERDQAAAAATADAGPRRKAARRPAMEADQADATGS